MKRPYLISMLLITWIFLSFQQVAMAEPSADLVERVTKLAHANDWMSDKMLEEVKWLRASANEHFLVFMQIIEATEDDAVLNTAMSFAESATNHKSELSETAAKLLSKRDASLFPSSIQRALAILGASGDKKHIPQVKAFASNPQILIRTAAETALNNLENKIEAEPTTSNQNLPPVVQPPVPDKTHQSKPPISASSEEPTSLTPWSIIVVLIVVASGLLWLALKRRS